MLKGDKKKECQRDYMKRKRSNKGMELGAGNVRPFKKEALAMLDPYTGKYPQIVRALCDPAKRVKLEKVYLSLKEHKVTEKVFYGFPGLGGIPFDMIGGYLEVTR